MSRASLTTPISINPKLATQYEVQRIIIDVTGNEVRAIVSLLDANSLLLNEQLVTMPLDEFANGFINRTIALLKNRGTIN